MGKISQDFDQNTTIQSGSRLSATWSETAPVSLERWGQKTV